ncbi:MAG: 3-phosphoshikimate 1-carboxyvinyltransferase, partial [Propionibacteriaceae bacterium]|nr:3-phosphoshikimate 1-carboxyvinyltransferase [Propionibacteriaceae bacterium]
MPWAAPYAETPITASVEIPGSKSIAARSLVLAGLAEAPSLINGVPDGRDTELLRAGLAAMGVGIAQAGAASWQITPPARMRSASIDVGLSGTAMRFLPAVAALSPAETRFYGDPQASARPMAGLLGALRQLGVDVSGAALPFSITGPDSESATEVRLDSAPTSQFISGLLLIGAKRTRGLRIVHQGPPLPSRPHISMTALMLKARGVEVSQSAENVWEVSPGPISGLSERIEPDLTNTATFLAAGAVTRGRVGARWPETSVQPGCQLLSALRAFGAEAVIEKGCVCVIGPDKLNGAELDLREISEFTPVAAAMAALAEGPSRISGVGHITGHETNRLQALATELSALGCHAEATSDGLAISPGPLRPGVFHTYADHRMAHAGALLGLRVPGIKLD